MLTLGDYNTLKIVKTVDFGLYLDGGEEGEILLPQRYVTKDMHVGDEITYIGTISAGNDIDIRVTNPSSDGKGIRIGELSENETLLKAGNEARFYVNGDGNIHFAGDVIAEKGDVIADISGTGNVEIHNSVQSENASVSMGTEAGNIVIGTDNTPNDETITAKKNISV